MFNNTRSQSMDLLLFDNDGGIKKMDAEKNRSYSLESGLENIEHLLEPLQITKSVRDVLTSELKQQCHEKDKEITRLKAVELNYGQVKQQLKDIKWMLKVCFLSKLI